MQKNILWIPVFLLIVLSFSVNAYTASYWWSMNSTSGVIANETINGFNATFTSGTTWGVGNFSNEVILTANTDRGATPDIDFTSWGNGTWTFFLNVSTNSNAGAMIRIWNSDSERIRIIGRTSVGASNLSLQANSDGQSVLENFGTTLNDRVHYCIMWNGGQIWMYVDGILKRNLSWAASPADFPGSAGVGFLNQSTDEQSIGGINVDEVWLINETISSRECNDIMNYNNVSKPSGEDSTPPTINITYPINGRIYNLNYSGWINATVTDSESNIDNCIVNNTDWTFNTSTTPALITNFSFFNSSTFSDGTYSVLMTCNDTFGNSGTQAVTFIIDTVSPTITLNTNNEFNIINQTRQNQYDDNFQINITFTDTRNLFAFQINITQGATVLFNFTNTSLSGTSFTYDNLLSISSWSEGFYNISVWVSDSHTAFSIDNYDITKKRNELAFDTEEGNYIRIISEDDASTSTNKLKDRYTMTYEFSDKLNGGRTFDIYSREKIYYLKNSEFDGHFVILNGKRGNWIDFEGVGERPFIQKINDYHYTVTFDYLDSKVTFNSIGGLNIRNENFTWYRGVTNESFQNHVFGSDIQNFFLNVSNSSAIKDITATFFYNLTAFTVTRTPTGERFIFNASGTIPIIDGTSTIFPISWNITVTQPNGTIVLFSLTDTQNASNFDFGPCSATLTTPTINFSILDELNLSPVRANMVSVVTFWLNNRAVNRTKTFTQNLDTVNYTFCAFPNNITLNLNHVTDVSSTTYQQRQTIETDLLITNVTTQKTIYLLELTAGIFARLRTTDQFENVITGVAVLQQKDITGTGVFVTIGNQVGDDSGVVTFFVNPDDTYRYTFTKTGFAIQIVSLRITSTDIFNVIMTAEGTGVDSPPGTGVNFLFGPSNTVIANGTNITFSFNYSSSFFDITDCTLFIFNATQQVQYINSSTSFTTRSCNISININTRTNTTFVVKAIVNQNGTQNITYRRVYSIRDLSVGQFSLQNLIDDIRALNVAGFNNFTRMIIAFLLIFALTASASKFTGLADPDGVIIFIWTMVGFFSFLGFFILDYPGMPDFLGLQQYMIFYMTTLLGTGFIFWRNV